MDSAPPSIARRIVQIWLGDDPPPTRWVSTWATAHPTFEHHLWREDDIEAFGLRNRALFGRLLAAKVYDAASDVARVEILERLGGVYIDADSICLEPLDDAPFMHSSFFATREIHERGGFYVTNAFMGSVPGHPLLRSYIDHLATARVVCRHGEKFCCAWRQTGPKVLSRLILQDTSAMILPPAAFFTQTILGEPIEGTHYAEHYWSSSTARSPANHFAGRTYEEAR